MEGPKRVNPEKERQDDGDLTDVLQYQLENPAPSKVNLGPYQQYAIPVLPAPQLPYRGNSIVGSLQDLELSVKENIYLNRMIYLAENLDKLMTRDPLPVPDAESASPIELSSVDLTPGSSMGVPVPDVPSNPIESADVAPASRLGLPVPGVPSANPIELPSTDVAPASSMVVPVPGVPSANPIELPSADATPANSIDVPVPSVAPASPTRLPSADVVSTSPNRLPSVDVASANPIELPSVDATLASSMEVPVPSLAPANPIELPSVDATLASSMEVPVLSVAPASPTRLPSADIASESHLGLPQANGHPLKHSPPPNPIVEDGNLQLKCDQMKQILCEYSLIIHGLEESSERNLKDEVLLFLQRYYSRNLNIAFCVRPIPESEDLGLVGVVFTERNAASYILSDSSALEGTSFRVEPNDNSKWIICHDNWNWLLKNSSEH